MRSRVFIVLCILGVAVVTGGWLLGRGMHGTASSSYVRERLFDQVVTHVERYYVDSVAPADLFDKALVGMLTELGDPHSLYLKPDRLKRLRESTKGIYTGLGLQVDVRDGWPTVLAPIPGGPAERAGLQSGDRIVEISGKSTKGWTTDEVRNALRGPVGTNVGVIIERPGSSTRIPVTLTRDEIHRRAVRRTALLAGGVGYVEVTIFNDSTELELARAIDSLSRGGMRSLVLDLRGNPGGLLAQGIGVSDLFLDPGTPIVSMRGRIPEANRSFNDGSKQRWPTLPLVVLIDDGSASASEIVAGALQDHDRAIILGRPSYGKGSAQSLYPTTTGGALKLTTARWYTPSGRSIDRAHRPEEENEDAGEAPPRETFKTDAGRTIYGGGGITPDVMAGDTVLAPEELALQSALGPRVAAFRDALTAYALSLKTAGTVRSADFQVTSEMLDGLWRLMERRGFSFDRAVYDGAHTLVSMLLARDVARYVFGPAAESARSIREDLVIRAAVSMASGVSSQKELLERAARK